MEQHRKIFASKATALATVALMREVCHNTTATPGNPFNLATCAEHPDLIPAVARMGAAQACLESAYGTSKAATHHRNVLGIKPSSPSHSHVDVIRIFTSIEQCFESWAYLVARSTHYTKVRNALEEDLGAADLTFEETMGAFEEAFANIYCPADADYANKISILSAEITDALAPPAKTKPTTSPAARRKVNQAARRAPKKEARK